MDTGELIRNLRVEKGLTQEELGNLLGLKKAAINKYEKGRVENIKRSVIEKMAEIFEVSPCSILGYTEDIKQPSTPPISLEEQKLLKSFNKLNDIGKREAVKRVDELTYVYDYTKRFTTRDEAWEYLKGFKIAAFGGINFHKMLDEELIEKANIVYEEHNK